MSARSLNLIQLIGNLTRDPELRYTPNGSAVCTMGLATNRSWTSGDGSGQRQEETTYHRIVVWGKLAEICGQMLKKGSKAYVQGRLQNRKWTTKEGQERETVEIVADQVIILSPSANRETTANPQGGEYAYPETDATPTQESGVAPAATAPMTTDDVSDDIPF